jgi:hypothetical protein
MSGDDDFEEWKSYTVDASAEGCSGMFWRTRPEVRLLRHCQLQCVCVCAAWLRPLRSSWRAAAGVMYGLFEWAQGRPSPGLASSLLSSSLNTVPLSASLPPPRPRVAARVTGMFVVRAV